MNQVIPNIIGPLIYLNADNFLLEDILSNENYFENDGFHEIIEHHLSNFAQHIIKSGFSWNYKEHPNLSKDRVLQKYNFYYNFSDKKYNTKIFYYRSFLQDGIDTSRGMEFMYKPKGFFQREVTILPKLNDKSLFIFDDSFEASINPTYQWSLDVTLEKKSGYKKIYQGEQYDKNTIRT